jgi:hypothetical protein
MHGLIYQYLAEDHDRLEDALQRAMIDPNTIESSHYVRFREGLLRHIAMEEKILLPAARAAQGGKPLAGAERLRLDHAALAALLVPTPTKPILAAIRTVIDQHNRFEEGPDGIYNKCEELIADDFEEILNRLRTLAPVRLAPNVDNPTSMESARYALRKAGYDINL